MKHPAGVAIKMSVDVYNHTQHTLVLLFINWQLVSTSSMGHHQANIQEHECIEKLITVW